MKEDLLKIKDLLQNVDSATDGDYYKLSATALTVIKEILKKYES